MSKHKGKSYDLVRRYTKDIFGSIAIHGFRKKWSEETQSFKVYYKNIKVIQKRIKEKLIEKIERKKESSKRKGKKYIRPFFYRVDIVRLKPKRKKISLFGSILRRRHFLRKFAAKISVNQFRTYLKKSSKSSKMLKRFLELFESRLDVMLYRLNLFEKGTHGRQQINHKNFLINDEVCIFPSKKVNFLDLVSVVNKKKYFFFILDRIRKTLEQINLKYAKRKFFSKILKRRGLYKKYKKLGTIFHNVPSYIEVNYRTLTALFISYPSVGEVFFPFKTIKTKFPSMSKRFSS